MNAYTTIYLHERLPQNSKELSPGWLQLGAGILTFNLRFTCSENLLQPLSGMRRCNGCDCWSSNHFANGGTLRRPCETREK
jgi:hypothetical protein